MAIGYSRTQIKENQIQDKFFKYSLNGNKIKFFIGSYFDGYKIIPKSIQEITINSLDTAITRIDLIYLKTDGTIDIIYGIEDNIVPDFDFNNIILKLIRTGITNVIKESDLEYFKDEKYIKTNLYTIEETNYLSEVDASLTSYGV